MSNDPHGGRDLVQKSQKSRADLVSATGADLAVTVEPEGLLMSGDRAVAAPPGQPGCELNCHPIVPQSFRYTMTVHIAAINQWHRNPN